MAGERIRLEVRERERRGSADARRLRRQGLVPGVLYGRGKTPHAIAIPERELRRVFSSPAGLHAILDVVLDGQKTAHPSILKEYQQHPLRGTLSHAQVTVTLLGEAAGVKEGGVLSQVTREITVEALPMEIPEHIDLDVSGMAIGDSLRVADLGTIEGVTFLDDPEDTVLANVTPPTVMEEPEVEEEAEALEEGAEVPEGEGAPEGEAAAESPAAAESETEQA
jgi:large subunit ribosomal protein L25